MNRGDGGEFSADHKPGRKYTLHHIFALFLSYQAISNPVVDAANDV